MSRVSTTFYSIALLAALSGACRTKPTRADEPAARDAAPDLVHTSAAAPQGDARAPRAEPPSEDAFTKRAAYLAGGRAATKKGDTAAAVKAFSDALEIFPDDPQVLGERGFAKLHGGDDAGARADFDRAILLGGSPTLRAQLYFNVGLLEEKQGHTEAARSAFALSQRLHPTPAAAAKVAAAHACPVAFEVPPAPQTFGTWLDAVRAIAPSSQAQTLSEARSAICTDGCFPLDGGHILVLSNGDVLVDGGHRLILLKEAVVEVMGEGFKCASVAPVVTATLRGSFLRLDSGATLCNTVCRTDRWVDCSPDSEGTRRGVSLWDLRAPLALGRVTWDDAIGEESSTDGLVVGADGSLSFQGCALNPRVALPIGASGGLEIESTSRP